LVPGIFFYEVSCSKNAAACFLKKEHPRNRLRNIRAALST